MKRKRQISRLEKRKQLFTFVTIIVTIFMTISMTTKASAKALIEPGDENYVRIGAALSGRVPYRTEPEPIIATYNGGRQEITGWNQPSDGAIGFLRGDFSENPIYQVVRAEILNGVAVEKTNNRKYDFAFTGHFIWTPTDQANMDMYLNIARNCVVDMIKSGEIKNGDVGFMGVASAQDGALRFNESTTVPKCFYYRINADFYGRNDLFAKHPELKPYFTNGR